MDSLLEKRGSSSSKSEDQSETSLDKRRRVLREDIAAIGEVHVHGPLLDEDEIPKLEDDSSHKYDVEEYDLEGVDNLEDNHLVATDTTEPNNFHDYASNAAASAPPATAVAAADDSDIEEYEEDIPILCVETCVAKRKPRRRSPRRFNSNIQRVPITVSAPNNQTDLHPDSFFDSKVLAALILDELPKDNPLDVARALEKLGSILKHSKDGTAAHQAVALGGHSVLVLTMKQWPLHEPIQRHAFHCVFRMIGGHYRQQQQQQQQPSSPQEATNMNLVESFLVMGVVDEIVRALRAFPESSELQVFGIGALGNLIGTASTPIQGNSGYLARRAAARKFVKESRGVALVVDAMRIFPEHAKLQELGCWVCACLCLLLLGNSSSKSKSNSKTAARVMKCEALVAVSTAVQNYPDNRAIGKQAACFMVSLFRSSK